MKPLAIIDEYRVDERIDEKIIAFLNADPPKSFFLFAGAGSGKTRALVNTLHGVRETRGKRMRLHGQQIAVITYTNAACDEIIRRLDFDPLFVVKTIHSFVWDLIQGFNIDIRLWLRNNLQLEIEELQELQRKGRAGSQAATDRMRKIEATQKRVGLLDSIKQFVYSPNHDNKSRDSLNHSEVIKIGADFLKAKPLMQQLLINRFPILLIDESQDTNKLLMEALLEVQAEQRARFALGLFGDTMQRIYSDGKVDLGRELPPDWETPAILVNHRCPRRVTELINKIRSSVDTHVQQFGLVAPQGHVRLFISESGSDKQALIEEQAREKMAKLTGDANWSQLELVKTLILEHHMAARRLQFFELYEPLYQIDEFKTGLRAGTLPLLRFFSELLMPLVDAKNRSDDFAAAAVVRKASPLLSKNALEAAGADQIGLVNAAKVAVEKLMSLYSESVQPRFGDILRSVAQNKLFIIPDALVPFGVEDAEKKPLVDTSEVSAASEEELESTLSAIRKFLDAPFDQIRSYAAYVRGETAFATHQGVKGLEFPRVMVVMDDEEAGGFLFSYEKLFGARVKTNTDLENERKGSETGIDRTRRLFYVTCSRSKESLAIIAYSSSPAKVKEHAIQQGWFDESEIEFLM